MLEPHDSAVETPLLSGPCQWLKGRISIMQGAPEMVIWPIGTKRLLGVIPSEDEIVPTQISQLFRSLDDFTGIFGDFEVCPFTKQTAGAMQFVCIESARSVSVRTYRNLKQ